MADLVVGTGDPLEITTAAFEQVYVEGRAVSDGEPPDPASSTSTTTRPRGPKARARAGQTTSMR